jgi:hypothetical protein
MRKRTLLQVVLIAVSAAFVVDAHATQWATFGGYPLYEADRSCFAYATPGYGAVKNTCASAKMIGWSIPIPSGTTSLTIALKGTFASSTSTECYVQATKWDLSDTDTSGWTASSSGSMSMTTVVPSGKYQTYVICSIGPNDVVNSLRH